jgi:transcriptional regulator with XRE-family HTH domain
MNTAGAPTGAGAELAFRIAKLVEEKGWNQEDFARISGLNRHTVRLILNGGPKRRLRNATVGQCAKALGLTVDELRTLPTDRLLLRMHGKAAADEEALRILHDRATLPELSQWLDRNRERAAALRRDEIEELLDLQQPGGPLERLGVEHGVGLIERRRDLCCKIKHLAGTEYFETLEQLVGLMAEKVGRGPLVASRPR